VIMISSFVINLLLMLIGFNAQFSYNYLLSHELEPIIVVLEYPVAYLLPNGNSYHPHISLSTHLAVHLRTCLEFPFLYFVAVFFY
jgi:hypothetical protein